MAHRRKSVRKIKETIRLHEVGFNKKQIAGSVTTSRKTVRKYIERVESLGLTYAEIEKMDNVTSGLGYDIFTTDDLF